MEQFGGGKAHLLNRSGADHFGVALAEIKDRKEYLLQLLSAFLVAIFGSDTKLLAGPIERSLCSNHMIHSGLSQRLTAAC